MGMSVQNLENYSSDNKTSVLFYHTTLSHFFNRIRKLNLSKLEYVTLAIVWLLLPGGSLVLSSYLTWRVGNPGLVEPSTS
jgi:hypothetical protein